MTNSTIKKNSSIFLDKLENLEMAFLTIAPIAIVTWLMIFSYPAPININIEITGLICYSYKLPQKIYTNGEN